MQLVAKYLMLVSLLAFACASGALLGKFSQRPGQHASTLPVSTDASAPQLHRTAVPARRRIVLM